MYRSGAFHTAASCGIFGMICCRRTKWSEVCDAVGSRVLFRSTVVLLRVETLRTEDDSRSLIFVHRRGLVAAPIRVTVVCQDQAFEYSVFQIHQTACIKIRVVLRCLCRVRAGRHGKTYLSFGEAFFFAVSTLWICVPK